MQIPTDKIREVIGTGGKVIREIVEKTGAKIDIQDTGTIKIASSDGKAIKAAYNWIRSIVAEGRDRGDLRRHGRQDDGVRRLRQLLRRQGRPRPHLGARRPARRQVTDVVKEGDKVKVKFLGQDDRGKIRLSMKVVDQQTGEDITEKLKAQRDADRTRERGEGGNDDGPRSYRGGRRNDAGE